MAKRFVVLVFLLSPVFSWALDESSDDIQATKRRKTTIAWCLENYLRAAPVCSGPKDRECEKFATKISAVCARIWKASTQGCVNPKAKGAVKGPRCKFR